MGYVLKGQRANFGLGQYPSGSPGARIAQDGEAVLGIMRRTVGRDNGPFPNDPGTLNGLKTGMATMGFTAAEQERVAILFAANPNPSPSDLANAMNALVMPSATPVAAPAQTTTPTPTPTPISVPSDSLPIQDVSTIPLDTNIPDLNTQSPEPVTAPELLSTQKYLNNAYLVMGGIAVILALVIVIIFRK